MCLYALDKYVNRTTSFTIKNSPDIKNLSRHVNKTMKFKTTAETRGLNTEFSALFFVYENHFQNNIERLKINCIFLDLILLVELNWFEQQDSCLLMCLSGIFAEIG